MTPSYVMRARFNDLMTDLVLGLNTRDALRRMTPTEHRDHRLGGPSNPSIP